MQNGQLTTIWGKTVIDQLVRQGVHYFCLSPGFRSTPLAIAAAEHPDAKTFVHFDERATAFHALGYAKATGKPAAMIATSGTALGNLLPAIMEAKYAQVPLIVLTCDRPVELRDVMANQACDQVKIFSDMVNYFFELPSPTMQLPERLLATTIAQLVARATYPSRGPVQLDCPFAEPFFDDEVAEALPLQSVAYTMPQPTLTEDQIEKWVKELKSIEKGVILLGANGACQGIEALSEKLDWPIFADINSSYRHVASPRSIPYYHHIVKTLPDLTADAVLHFGDAFVSKFVMRWVAKQKRVIHIAPHGKRCDPLHCVTDQIVCEPQFFCSTTSNRLEKKKGWFGYWKELSQLEIDNSGLTEPGVFKELENHQEALFIANSMPIRDAEMFFFPKKARGPIFANRGLSGIDGNIGTCAGIASQMPLIAIMGDQTFLHDLNSLAQLKKTKHPVKLIVINNGGGGVFSFVAIGDRKDLLDTYFAAAHDIEFSKAAELFGLDYVNPKTREEFASALSKKGSQLIEITTNRQENLQLHQEIDKQVKTQLCSSFCTAS